MACTEVRAPHMIRTEAQRAWRCRREIILDQHFLFLRKWETCLHSGCRRMSKSPDIIVVGGWTHT